MSIRYYIAFWNLENLFDIENSPRRSDKLRRAIGKGLQGWTQVQLDQKISQLASIILQLNGGAGPDILGVCEVENKYVMDLLVAALSPLQRNYGVVHHDMGDGRGIDVGFVYDNARLNPEGWFSHFVMRRTATRDILQVNFLTTGGRRIVLMGNHWPSRSGGPPVQSAGYRAIAGETLAYFHERIVEVHGEETAILACGDFNDEPFDRSLEDYALSMRSSAKVTNAKKECFLNLMWPLMGQGLGSFYYDSAPFVFDQFLAGKQLIKANAPVTVVPGSVEIVRLPEMVKPGQYPTPIPFGGMGKQISPNGFSDHFPIALSATEV